MHGYGDNNIRSKILLAITMTFNSNGENTVDTVDYAKKCHCRCTATMLNTLMIQEKHPV